MGSVFVMLEAVLACLWHKWSDREKWGSTPKAEWLVGDAERCGRNFGG